MMPVKVVAGLLVAAAAIAGCVPATPAASAPGPDTVRVVYWIDGTADFVNMTYTNGAGDSQEQKNVPLPNALAVWFHHGDYVHFSATNHGPSGTLRCSIQAEGHEIASGTASGPWGLATCSARVP